VIGDDDRTLVSPTTNAPWRMICQLTIEFPYDTVPGTGWLAGHRTVITAGHCLLNDDLGGAAKSIAIVPARDGDQKPFGEAKAASWAPHDFWLNNRDPDWDIGHIQLVEPLDPAKVGAFAYAPLPDTTLNQHYVNLAGYPRSISKYLGANGDRLVHHANRIQAVGVERLFYDIDASGGQSGAPVWIHETAGAAPIVVGVHAKGWVAGQSGLGGRYNSSPRLTQAKCDAIDSWLARDQAPIA